MKTLNYVKILLLCVFTIGLASCGDDVYYTMQNSDDKLCGKTWIEEYQTENKDGVEVLCSHQLKFAKADNSGQEIWEYYRGGESRPYETTSRTFTWKWMDKSMEGLTLKRRRAYPVLISFDSTRIIKGRKSQQRTMPVER